MPRDSVGQQHTRCIAVSLHCWLLHPWLLHRCCIAAPSACSVQADVVNLVVDKILQVLDERGESVSMMLQRMDENGDGLLQPSELRNGLVEEMNLDLSEVEFDALMTHFDEDGDGAAFAARCAAPPGDICTGTGARRHICARTASRGTPLLQMHRFAMH